MHISKDNLSKKILSWYDNNKRTLPWRISQNSEKKHYYRILSEFMLQQTQVKTVIPYFRNFVKKIPNLKTLSFSKVKMVLKLWEGLGYYRRARNLHKTSKILVKKYKSKLPKKYDEIKKLPGVGDYTAKALLALVYNQNHIPFDGNVKRVFNRLYNLKLKNDEQKIEKIIKKNFFTSRNGDLAEALMEFGAIVCKPQNPECSICDLRKKCYFFKHKKISILFSKKRNEKEKKYNIYCYLKKKKKEIALTNNKKISFLNNFKIPKITIIKSNNKKKREDKWIYICSYKNNISNIKMNIDLFYKFVKTKPQNFVWYRIDRPNREFIPSFTKKIFRKIIKVYS